MSTTALEVFREQRKGIETLIVAAEVLTLHLIAKMRGTPPEMQILDRVLEGKSRTGFALLGMSYHADEIESLAKNGNVRQLGQQIVAATYTAIESYLGNKFEEYYRFKLASEHPQIVDRTLVNLRRSVDRSLKDARRMYRDYLDIDLAFFDLRRIMTTEPCAFRPNDSWEALTLISRARNEIAHTGACAHPISNLIDAWYPFEFACDWIEHFDANFDILLYKGWSTNLIKAYSTRRAEAGTGKA